MCEWICVFYSAIYQPRVAAASRCVNGDVLCGPSTTTLLYYSFTQKCQILNIGFRSNQRVPFSMQSAYDVPFQNPVSIFHLPFHISHHHFILRNFFECAAGSCNTQYNISIHQVSVNLQKFSTFLWWISMQQNVDILFLHLIHYTIIGYYISCRLQYMIQTFKVNLAQYSFPQNDSIFDTTPAFLISD